MEETKTQTKVTKVVSLRVKLLVSFTFVFSLVVSGSYYWFYHFATHKTIDLLKSDLQETTEGAAKGVDVEELLALYQEGIPNVQGFSNDPRYQNQLDWFATVRSMNPQVYPYTLRIGKAKENRRIGESIVPEDKFEIIYLVDWFWRQNPQKAARFLEAYPAQTHLSFQIWKSGQTLTSEFYEDEWGSWISAYTPLKNSQGEIVAILGADIQADYVQEMQRNIQNTVGITLIITCILLLGLIYVISALATKPVQELQAAAEQITQGDYAMNLSRVIQRTLKDEISVLAQAFEVMTESIRKREEQIREGKQVEAEIRLSLEKERELSELKSRFVSMTSHEFRTPLSTILSSSELLEHYRHRWSEHKQLTHLHRIQDCVQQMTEMLNDILIIGRAEAGKLVFHPIPTDLLSLCHDILEEFQLQIHDERQILFTHQGDCQDIFIDNKLVRHILCNLLSNALKYSSSDTPIILHFINQGDEIIFEITDQGIGIPPEDQEYLFESFYRASNVENIQGTGLGLAIVHRCVEQHRGQVEMKSQLGVGTTFRVILPLVKI